MKVTWPSGDRYEGGWSGDKRKGQGTFWWLFDEAHYEGEWEDDKFHGQGTYWYENGERWIKHVGGWKADLEHGYGELYYRNGKLKKGTWKNGNEKDVEWGPRWKKK